MPELTRITDMIKGCIKIGLLQFKIPIQVINVFRHTMILERHTLHSCHTVQFKIRISILCYVKYGCICRLFLHYLY